MYEQTQTACSRTATQHTYNTREVRYSKKPLAITEHYGYQKNMLLFHFPSIKITPICLQHIIQLFILFYTYIVDFDFYKQLSIIV